MSGTYPASPEFSSVDFKINTPVQTTETVNGRKRRSGFGVSYYSFAGKYASLTPSQAASVTSFVAKQYGQLESFQIVLPKISYTKSTNQTTTTVTTSAAAVKGAKQVSVTGVATGKDLLKAGDYFRFNNHTKVYMCVDDWSAGQQLFFSGGLVSNVPSGTQLTITAVPFTVILDQDVDEFTVANGGMTNIEVSFREVW